MIVNCCIPQVLQTVYFGICLLNDLFGSNLKPWDNLKERSTLQRVRDNFVACIVWPVGTVSVFTVLVLTFPLPSDSYEQFEFNDSSY